MSKFCIYRFRVLDQIFLRKGGQKLQRCDISTCSYVKLVSLKIALLPSLFCAVSHKLSDITYTVKLQGRTHKTLGFLHILSKLGTVSMSNTANANFACSYKDTLTDPLEFAKAWVNCPGPLHSYWQEETTKRRPITLLPGTSLEVQWIYAFSWSCYPLTSKWVWTRID